MGWLDRWLARARKRAAQAAVDSVKKAGEAVGSAVTDLAERELEKGRASERMRAEREAQEAERRRELFGDPDDEGTDAGEAGSG